MRTHLQMNRSEWTRRANLAHPTNHLALKKPHERFAFCYCTTSPWSVCLHFSSAIPWVCHCLDRGEYFRWQWWNRRRLRAQLLRPGNCFAPAMRQRKRQVETIAADFNFFLNFNVNIWDVNWFEQSTFSMEYQMTWTIKWSMKRQRNKNKYLSNNTRHRIEVITFNWSQNCKIWHTKQIVQISSPNWSSANGFVHIWKLYNCFLTRNTW